MEPYFSIVIPAYNAHKFIVPVLECIKKQTYPNYEVIVIENGSQDDTYELLAAFKKNHDEMRLQIIKVPENVGISGARNLGTQAANYEYVSYIDVDDFWYPDKLEAVSQEIIKNPEIDVFCHWENVVQYETGEVVKINKYPQVNNEDAYLDLLTYGNKLSTSAITIKKNKMLDVKCFSPVYTSGEEDYDCWLRLAKSGAKFLQIERPLGEYRLHGGNVSGNQLKHTDAVNHMLSDHIAVIKKDRLYPADMVTKIEKQVTARGLYHKGSIYSQNKNKIEALYCLTKSIHLNPFKIKTYIAMAFAAVGR